MSGSLIHLNWEPVILLKIVRMPFGGLGGLSLKRAYLAHDEGRLLHADWTLEAAERAEGLVSATGWMLKSTPIAPFRLQGKGAKIIPSGTWVLPYSDHLFVLYSAGSAALTDVIKHIDQYPTDPVTLSALVRLSQIL